MLRTVNNLAVGNPMVRHVQMQEGILMSEQKRKIGFTVACVNEFANRHKLSSKEAFQYLFRFKGIAFIKENYDVEHTLDFDTILDDLGILCKKNGGTL